VMRRGTPWLALLVLLLAACDHRLRCASSIPGGSDSLSTEAKDMRARAIADGFPEVQIAWRTPREEKTWQQTMPGWMRKISPPILDHVRLLKEKNVLVSDRRHLAVRFTTDRVPVDSLARIFVECQVSDLRHLTKKYFHSMGAELVGTWQSHTAFPCLLTVWMCPECLQTLAQRSDVLSINELPAITTQTGH
jgi:hypothetical protein